MKYEILPFISLLVSQPLENTAQRSEFCHFAQKDV